MLKGKLGTNRRIRDERRGTALASTVIMVTVLAGLSCALLTIALGSTREQRQEGEEARARSVARAGVSAAMYNLQRGISGTIGSKQYPQSWGNGQYYVSQTNPSPDVYCLRATGVDDDTNASMELVVKAVPTTIWRFGAFGKEFLHMDSNARVDSYNSSASVYATQAVNGTGTNNHAAENGDVGSNGDISLDQNAKVWGDAAAGPGHDTLVLGNAFVTGSTVPMSATLTLPAINVPTYPSLGSLTVSANTTVASGNRRYTNLVVNNNKTLTITGPANIVVTNLELKSASALRVNTTGGPVTFWVIDDFIMRSNALMAPLDMKPNNLTVNLLSDNVINPEISIDVDDVSFFSNTQLHAKLYAPSAAIIVNSNFEMFGSVIARSIDLNSNASFHFDEALIAATSSGAPTFETICFRDIPTQ